MNILKQNFFNKLSDTTYFYLFTGFCHSDFTFIHVPLSDNQLYHVQLKLP